MEAASSVTGVVWMFEGCEVDRAVTPNNKVVGGGWGGTPPVPQDEDEHEPMFIQPHDPDYVPEPIYPKYIPLEDEHVFPVEEQPLPPVILYLSYCSDVLSGIRY
ncbi:hypothetical protein Tco_0941194 [Tanacetum coccineum]|uniref:Uncharacterized protein n=1 Tax=Tanacetum coccineum TaxID=301880 RepID=A0ABQ5DQI8_9ASTR